MAIESEPLFTVRLQRDNDTAVTVPNGPKGTRLIAAVAPGGRFEGDRLSGEILVGTSGDLATAVTGGGFVVDARLTLRTDDGAAILMSYRGVGGYEDTGDAWMHIAPVFETGDGRYDWINRVQCLGFGRLEENTVVYEVEIVTGRS